MHYTGTIYRPPMEAQSLVLQVTTGCSHNKCRFCTMYRSTPFHVSPLEEVEEDLREAFLKNYETERVFLSGGDVFTLSADRLIEIARLIHRYLPNVKVISMYANVNNIGSKTDEQLTALHELGIDDLNIGLESGDDAALKYSNKGYDSQEARKQILRLKKAGIRYALNIIFGLAGKERSAENAINTASLISDLDPFLIFTNTVHYDEPDCELLGDIKSGRFHELTVREYVEEEKLFLEKVDVTDCIYYARHPSNVVPRSGMLPLEKEKLIEELEYEAGQIPPEIYENIAERAWEGAMLVD